MTCTANYTDQVYYLCDELSMYSDCFGMNTQEANEWLATHEQEVADMVSYPGAKDQLDEIKDFYADYIPNHQIRRSALDSLPLNTGLLTKIKSLAIFKNLNEKKREAVQVLWDIYRDDREALLHGFMNIWNESRDEFKSQNDSIPFQDVALREIDEEFRKYVHRRDGMLSVMLLKAVLESVNCVVPETYNPLKGNVVNGCGSRELKLAIGKEVENKDEVLNDFFQKFGGREYIPKLEKKNVMEATGMSLDEFNSW